jgi:D-3-phosphoglycerate dehydrogenase / 2-oxoglutarate reductase
MTMKVLVTAPYMQPVISRFSHRFDEHGIELIIPPVTERASEEELLGWIGDVDGVIAGDDRFTERVLRAAPKLKVVSKWGTGIDSFDQEACQRLGIAVRNTSDAFSQPVADTVLGYAICLLRHLHRMDREVHAGKWVKRPGKALNECTFGIIGVGNVGKAVARRVRACGARLLGCDLVPMPEAFVSETGIVMVERGQLLAEADVVSLNCDLNPTSYLMMSDDALGRMRDGAYLINTARGPLIDERALVRALESGKLGGAAMDVFEEEPLPADSPIRRFSNVMLAPHNANSSARAWERVHINTIENLLGVLLPEREDAGAPS